MSTFALLTTPDLLLAPEQDLGGGFDIFTLKKRSSRQESAHSQDSSPLQTLSETVGIRSACRSVVRWYHGGINE